MGNSPKQAARRWNVALNRELDVVRAALGLPEGKLTAVLDKMLVYAPGQFFAPHQDSERADDMIGSLVVELPCAHSGGSVVVQHHREKRTFLLWLTAYFGAQLERTLLVLGIEVPEYM